MEGLPQWILCLSLCLAIIQLFLNVGNSMLDGRKLMSTNDPNHDTGFISIDCGAMNDYLDQETGFWYQTDNNFVETGTNSRVASDDPYFGEQLKTLRRFPEGKKNCYTLKPNQGKNNTYLIRAFFAYGNYDGKNQAPTFDLYLGVNLCDTVELEGYESYDYPYIVEIIHTPIVDTIDICLLNTGKGVPFISALELRPLGNAIYQIPKPSQSLLILEGRDDVASTSSATYSRYKDDIYDRTWTKYNISDRSWYNINDEESWQPFDTSANIDPENTSDPYKLPAQVLKSAAKVHNLSSSLNLDWTIDVSSRYYVYFHFLEIEKLGPGKKRIINITLGGENILSEPLVLEYLKPISISHQNPIQSDGAHFRISATSESDAPPILNAYEVYKLISPLQSPTEKTDADAIVDIKRTYKISRVDWQGDPCLPEENAWEGLICTSGIIDSKPRITSLNLRASQLTGNIATSLSQLTELESLDLSFNDLSGSVPEFLAQLPKLRVINLTSNKLTGSIPKALKEKSNLLLSLDENPGLCQTSSCKSRAQRPIVPIVASIVVVLIVVCISVVLWRLRSKRQRGASDKGGHMKAENGEFSKTEIICITKNFETVIGKGGFGNVYLGTLQDGAQVAVKILSESSRQGFKEFLSEVRLLKLIHHRNLVALVGYCDQDDMKALVYEYMNKGNLLNQLSDRNQNVLKWNERLQIAVDAACGLDYLHNGCKPPIVHRDLKPSNILLNKNMQAKISDFGLSRAFENENDTHILTFPAGTLGYIDPQLHTSKKSDIYSFGIILFEIITGKPAVTRKNGEVNQILDWVFPLIEKGDIQNIIDSRLQRNFNVTSAQKVIEAAMSCVSMDGAKRPDISHLLAELKECLNMEIMIHESSSSVIETEISIISAR